MTDFPITRVQLLWETGMQLWGTVLLETDPIGLGAFHATMRVRRSRKRDGTILIPLLLLSLAYPASPLEIWLHLTVGITLSP